MDHMDDMAYLKAQRFDFQHHNIKINVLIQAVEVAKSYYSCNDIEGVALENEGTSSVATYVPINNMLHRLS